MRRNRNAIKAKLRMSLPEHAEHAPSTLAYCWSGRDTSPLRRARMAQPLLADKECLREARSAESFAELLFPKCVLDGDVILMKDLCSTGRLFDLVPAQTEGRPEALLQDLHQRLLPLLRNVFPQNEHAPWVAQFFIQDQPRLADCFAVIEHYALQHSPDAAYTRHWLNEVRTHFQDVCRPEGVFFDPASQMIWKGRSRQVRLCVWRVHASHEEMDEQPLNDLCERLSHSLGQVGIQLFACSAATLCAWLADWFGPADKDAQILKPIPRSPLSLFEHGALGDLAHWALRDGAPWSSDQEGCWYFHGRPHRFLTVNALLREPEVGHFSAERTQGDRQQALWDSMPEGAIWMMAVTFVPQDQVLEHIAKVKRNSVGNTPQALAIRALAQDAVREVAEGNLILKVFGGVFVSADDMAQLEEKETEIFAILTAHGIAPIASKDDPLAQDAYVRALPFNFDPEQDARFYVQRSRLWFLDHVVRCLPLYGRTTGSGNAGLLAWNRGAEPLMFDPLNLADRTKNAHLFTFGPTGSGKTAFLINTLLHTVAVHRPRLYLITALPTFGLLAQHFAALELSVHHINGDHTSIPPFAEACELLEAEHGHDNKGSPRDLLGEMEIQARLMITGGDPKEEARLVREELNLIRKALLEMAQDAQGRPHEPVLTRHLVAVLYAAAESGQLQGDALSTAQCQSLRRMGNAIELFCTGRAGQIFNRPGETWPSVDVTVVELGALAHRRNEAWLAVAMSGLLSRINDQVQAQQYDARQTVVVLDEAHLLLKNPLVAPYILSISAMWRTYGAWLWIATQSLRQIPESARELLNQPEWWICMAMERDEVDMIARFRRLSEEQKAMILSARKEPGKYTEGVVMSGKLMTLFRNVPPALALALSQTEKDEKAHRAAVMRREGCSEIEAVYRIAEDIRQQRLCDDE